MDPKVLLMPVYSRGNEIERLRGALSLAGFFGAHLDVIYAQSKPSDLLGTELYSVSPKVREQLVSILDEDAVHDKERLRQHFEDLCRDYGVSVTGQPASERPSASWHEIRGARSELVAVHGRVSDVVIIPHSKTGEATLTFEEALLHTGRPVFLVPRGMWEFKLTNVLIGWDGGLECVRAVQQVLPFLKRAKGVTVGASADAPSDRPDAHAAVQYLAHHGVSAEVRQMKGGSLTIGAEILALGNELGCDLLVTGGYAHSRLRQKLLGGVTSHLLKHAEVPVLMAH